MNTALALVDYEPTTEELRALVLQGLSRDQKILPTAYLYDERGSELFERITELPEYYPTRTELAIMAEHVGAMAEAIGDEAMLIEYGSGSGLKTRGLLDALRDPVAYVPVDISRDHLLASAAAIDREFPRLEVMPVCADFTRPFVTPRPTPTPRSRTVYFPGSTIGNFLPAAAIRLLAKMRREAGPEGGVLIGVDLKKDTAVLEAAYNDAQGVTAEFNLNLLRRINRELGGEFDVDAFEHRAVWVESRGAIEMRLVSKRAQTVRVGERRFAFQQGEWIHTEDSHKYELGQTAGSSGDFASMADAAGLLIERSWVDARSYFAVLYLRMPRQ
jgi:L-histidine N-alpha-methyltransferase